MVRRLRFAAVTASVPTSASYEAAVVKLLAVLAATELTAFERLAADATLAPSVADKAELGVMAAAELRHYVLLQDALVARGADPDTAVTPFVEPVTEFHERTRPDDWLEGLMKAYVGDGLAGDFYREVAALLTDDDTRALVLEVLEDTGHAAFARERMLAAIAADPRVGGRLALWGRRLVGEALAQAQRVVALDDDLAHLLSGPEGSGGVDLAEIGRMFARMTENHARRMTALGLSA